MKVALWLGPFLALLLLSLAVPTGAHAQSAMPVVGSAAPPVSGVDQEGHTWKLSDLKGKSAVILYFYPKDGTPGCTREACGFRDQMNALKSAGVVVIGVSFDSAARHRNFIKQYGLNFDLLADTNGEIADAFGVRAANSKVARRVSFLIDQQGVIRHITDSPDASKHLEEMKKAVETLPK